MGKFAGTIRAATRNDAPAVTAIYTHHVLHGTATFDTEPPPPSVMAEKITEMTGKGWPFLVAELDGRVVGYAYAAQFRDREAYRFAEAYIAAKDLYIRELPVSNDQGF